MVTRSPEGGDKPSNRGLSDFKVVPEQRGVGPRVPKPEVQQQRQRGHSREQTIPRPQREYNPIEDALMDWRFNDDYNELLREVGIFIKGEPTGLPEHRQEKTIFDFNRTEGLAFTLAFARTLAVVWLEKHPDSTLAKEITETRVGFSLTGEQLMNFINEVAAEVKPPF